MMRTDNLLAVRFRKYILTTDSAHDCQVYVNLAARMTVTGINQLWVADITYIRLRVEFPAVSPHREWCLTPIRESVRQQ
jgi:putative transposase